MQVAVVDVFVPAVLMVVVLMMMMVVVGTWLSSVACNRQLWCWVHSTQSQAKNRNEPSLIVTFRMSGLHDADVLSRKHSDFHVFGEAHHHSRPVP